MRTFLNQLGISWVTNTPFYVDNQKTLHEDHLKPNLSCSHQTYWSAIPLIRKIVLYEKIELNYVTIDE
jgi:hypothetical protein